MLGLTLLLHCDPAGAQGLDALVSPGALSNAHHDLEGLEECGSCHTPGQGVDDAKCLDCHVELARRIQAGRGFHRTRAAQCATCHPEHRGAEASLLSWDPEHFDHGETGYPLVGLHQNVAPCVQCHSPARSAGQEQGSFLLTDHQCVTCHEDVHIGTLGSDCARCHEVQRKFSDVRFDHDRAAFHLRGTHRDLACAQCHRSGHWKGIAFSACTDCHTDPHRPSLGTDCSQCHGVVHWKVHSARARFHGEASAFPLEGKHGEVPCERCHRDKHFKGVVFDECRSCHTQDPHGGQFSQDCSACHSVEGFEKTTFDHQRALFHLTGKHLDLPCARCHEAEERRIDGHQVSMTRYRPLRLECGGCHRDVHLGQLGARCATCHSTFGFGISTLRFAHDTGTDFPLEGAHLKVDCAGCHRPEQSRFPAGAGTAVRYTPISRACRGCHRDPHASQLKGNCERCHTTNHFVPAARFDHQRTGFPLTGRHTEVACADCHPPVDIPRAVTETQPRRYHPLSTQCSTCHQDPHHYPEPPDCTRCHTTRTFSVRYVNHFKTAFPLVGRHAEVECESCHRPTQWRQRKVLTFVQTPADSDRHAPADTDCVQCHTSPHRSRYESCEQCHTFRSWRIRDW